MRERKKKKVLTLGFFPFLIILLITIITIGNISSNTQTLHDKNNTNYFDYNSPNTSGFIWARLDLTNPLEINNSRFTHYQEITIKGRLYNEYTGDNKTGNRVEIIIDGQQDSSYFDFTDFYGIFKINYTIYGSLDINHPHKIEAVVTTGIPLNGEVDYPHYYFINVTATSFFNILNPSPGIPGEDYSLGGYLSYDNTTGIPSRWINSTWINGTDIFLNPKIMTGLDGSFPTPLTIPNDTYSSLFQLNLTYFGDPFLINGNQTIIQINLFRNITCLWDIVSSAAEGTQITIRGQVLSNKTYFPINYRDVEIYYGPVGLIRTIRTDEYGIFQFSYQIPEGIGIYPIDVEVPNSLGLTIRSNTTHYITVTAATLSSTSSPSGKSTDSSPPFFNFLIVLIPIIIGGVTAFIIYAYFFLKKQEEQSRLVKVPLEGRIRNLKILKDTGRLEESLSYLFQAIYLELINAKYGRIKQKTETIRDFAIISVKELSLNPANIYPFIQNVEKIIYDKPFIITEEEFYTAVDLFSPIYFDLTGYNFILNF